MYEKAKKWSESVDRSIYDPIYIGEQHLNVREIRMISYDSDNFFIETYKNLSDVEKKSDINWLQITGLHDVSLIKDIGQRYKIHPLTIEDILNMSQSPKIEEYEDYVFIVTKNLIIKDEKIQVEQVSFIIKDDIIISFKEMDTELFKPVIEKLKLKSPLRSLGQDMLFYNLLDSLVDDYFYVIDKISEEIDLLEDEVLLNPDKEVLQRIYILKRRLIYLRKVFWPTRNILNKLSRNDYYDLSSKVVYYFRDIYDHLIQMIDIVETYREICSGLLDTYLSSIGNRNNDIMKILTIFSTISVPLTFLTGVYGMNFKYQPELSWRYAYPFFWFMSIAITIFMLKYFRDKDWI